MKKIKIYLLFIGLTFLACSPGAVFEDYHSIKNENWCRNDIAEFQAEIPAAGRYAITLCLRHTIDYELANLWCFMKAWGPSDFMLRDTVNIKVAEPDGHWVGKGNGIKTLEQSINSKVVDLPQGKVTVRLEQAMRIECLKGVKDIGIKITKLNTPD